MDSLFLFKDSEGWLTCMGQNRSSWDLFGIFDSKVDTTLSFNLDGIRWRRERSVVSHKKGFPIYLWSGNLSEGRGD